MSSDVLKRAASILTVGLVLSACSSMGTVVAEDDPETEVPNLSMGRSIMEGLGAVPARRQAINYTPRAPLVMPKDTAALAPPEDARTVTEDPSWPLDPDVESARRLREAEARQVARGDKGEIVEPSELLAERTPRSPKVQGDLSLNNKVIPPSQLRNAPQIGGDSGLYNSAGQPVRRALVQPPVQYLEPAPGAPVAIPEEPAKQGGLFSWLPW